MSDIKKIMILHNDENGFHVDSPTDHFVYDIPDCLIRIWFNTLVEQFAYPENVSAERLTFLSDLFIIR